MIIVNGMEKRFSHTEQMEKDTPPQINQKTCNNSQ